MPIVFIHEGYSPYLEFTLRQAHHASPESEIVLLGDAENNRFSFLAHIDIRSADYAAAGEEIAEVYRHMATNPRAVTLRWLQRWFWLRTYLRQSDEPSVWVLDSDVLLFAPESELSTRYAQDHELALAIPSPQEPYIWTAGPQASYWTRETVESFCDFAFRSYTASDLLSAYEAKWDHHQRGAIPGGVCDMTTLYLFSRETPYSNVLEVRNHAAFDLNINSSENTYPDEYQTSGGIKRLSWDAEGRPCGYRKEAGEVVRFLGLHLQGQAKRFMGALYTGADFPGRRSLAVRLRWYYIARSIGGKAKWGFQKTGFALRRLIAGRS